MQECPVCGKEYKNLGVHIKEQHPEYLEEEETKKEEVTAEKAFFSKQDRIMKRLESQNEVLMTQLQQNSLITALATGKNPNQQQEKTSIKEALELIKQIQGIEAPAVEEKEEDSLMKEGLNILKEVIKMKAAQTSSPDVETPPLDPLLDDETPEVVGEVIPPWRQTKLKEVKKNVKRLNKRIKKVSKRPTNRAKKNK